MPKTRKEWIYVIIIAAVILAIIGVLIGGLASRGRNQEELPVHTPAPVAPTTRVITKEVEKFVEVEKTITSDIIQDGLRDMGVLMTQQYYFTEVINFSSVKKFLKTDIALKFTESSYVASYDGTIFAGIDFSKTTVIKDVDAKKITVCLPKSAIQAITLDKSSFQVYSEKTGFGNPLTPEDFNTSLQELEENAKAKALERGILENADKNARSLVLNFISGLVDPAEYSLEFIEK